jgi:hypothetical protein
MADHTTGIVLLVKNDEFILPEWLAFHRALGFDRIHVFDNESTDTTPYLVRQAARRVSGISIEAWPSDVEYVERQRRAYERGLQIMRAEGVEWCLFIDSDEFMTGTADETLQQFLRRRDANAAIALHWSFYGSGGHVAEPRGLVIENYLLRAPANFAAQRLCKSFVRVPYVQGCLNGHAFILDPQNFPYVDCAGEPVQWESLGQDHVIAPWRINHYFVRSREWWAKKLARSNATAGFARHDHEWDIYDRNDFLDLSAARHGDMVREEMRRMGFAVPAMPDWSDPSLAGPARLIQERIRSGVDDGYGLPAAPPSRQAAARMHHPVPSGPPLRNVAMGKRATQSSISRWSHRQDLYEEAMGGANGVITGGYGFHTDEEDRPWWMVDLEAVFDIFEIRIFNRLEIPQRARLLSIWTSLAALDWRHVYTRSDAHDFGGADGNPLRVEFIVPPAARFVRIQLNERSILHLDEVEVYGRSLLAS